MTRPDVVTRAEATFSSSVNAAVARDHACVTFFVASSSTSAAGRAEHVAERLEKGPFGLSGFEQGARLRVRVRHIAEHVRSA